MLHEIVGECGLAAAVDDHGSQFCGVFHDGLVDAALWLGEGALDYAQIELFYFAVFEDTGEEFMCGFVFGEDDDAACLAVEAVDGEDISVAFAEPGFQGGFFAFAVGYAEGAGGFVDGYEAFIFEDDLGM